MSTEISDKGADEVDLKKSLDKLLMNPCSNFGRNS